MISVFQHVKFIELRKFDNGIMEIDLIIPLKVWEELDLVDKGK